MWSPLARCHSQFQPMDPMPSRDGKRLHRKDAKTEGSGGAASLRFGVVAVRQFERWTPCPAEISHRRLGATHAVAPGAPPQDIATARLTGTFDGPIPSGDGEKVAPQRRKDTKIGRRCLFAPSRLCVRQFERRTPCPAGKYMMAQCPRAARRGGHVGLPLQGHEISRRIHDVKDRAADMLPHMEHYKNIRELRQGFAFAAQGS